MLRTLPEDATSHPGQNIHLATCRRGREHDRKKTGGYDYKNTRNPLADSGRP